jgi:hypothetical protein
MDKFSTLNIVVSEEGVHVSGAAAKDNEFAFALFAAIADVVSIVSGGADENTIARFAKLVSYVEYRYQDKLPIATYVGTSWGNN